MSEARVGAVLKRVTKDVSYFLSCVAKNMSYYGYGMIKGQCNAPVCVTNKYLLIKGCQ